MTWVNKYIKAEWEPTEEVVYCKECRQQVDAEVDTEDGEKRCEICGDTDLLPTDVNMEGRCTDCDAEVIEYPDGNCYQCGGRGTVLYGDDAAYDPQTPEDVFELVERAYGTTGNMNCATWLLPNGFITNGCYGGARERGIDHREISIYMGKFKEGLEDSTDIMNKFMEMGAIRLKPSNLGPNAQIVGKPTADQIDALEDYFSAFPSGPYGLQFGFDNKDYVTVDEPWETGHELKKRFWAGYSIEASQLVSTMKKYASSLPRGYFDGLEDTLGSMRGSFVMASRKAVKSGGDAVDAAFAIEEVVYDQLSKRMGFEDVEVVESFGREKSASVTVFNPQTDEASEITIDLLTENVDIDGVIHEIDISNVLQRMASLNKEAISVKKIVRQRKYKHGYIIRDEYWALDPEDPEDEWTFMERVAYTPCGEYIGSSKDAYYICKVKGIIPRVASPDHTVCSIGYNPIQKKWYGWSHRAMYGFGLGDMIFDPEYGDDNTPYKKRGEKKIETMEDAMKAAIAFAAYVA